MIEDLTATDLTHLLEARRAAVDHALKRWLPSQQECPPELAAAMRYALFPGGKRLRPILVQLACEACGGNTETALPEACAVELVHCYSLVHDDLPAMDDDDLRRGRPTCHKKFGEAMAILTGDALLTLAFQVLTRYCQPAERAVTSCRELAWAAGACGMVGGQTDDLAPASLDQAARLGRLRSIHARKTGALLRASARLGAIASGAGAEQLECVDNYGDKIGLMFQITDDLLDVAGRQSKTGKRVGKDGRMGKLTYPAELGTEPSRQLVRQLCSEASACLDPLGSRADPLRQLARFIMERDR